MIKDIIFAFDIDAQLELANANAEKKRPKFRLIAVMKLTEQAVNFKRKRRRISLAYGVKPFAKKGFAF